MSEYTDIMPESIKKAIEKFENRLSFYATPVQDKIRQLDGEYYVDDMFDFIEEYGQKNFLEHYETYCSKGEIYSYKAVDFFCKNIGIDYLDQIRDSYVAEWRSFDEFVEAVFRESHDISEELEPYINWDKIVEDYKEDYIHDSYSQAVFKKNFQCPLVNEHFFAIQSSTLS